MSSLSDFNQSTSINLEDANVLKKNSLGQKPLKYFVAEPLRPSSDKSLTMIGNQKAYHEMKTDVRAKPTRLNEIDETKTMPINAAFLGGDRVNRKAVDVDSDLRWGGRVRCQKSQQLVSEEPSQRHAFLAPNEQQYISSTMLVTDANFERGGGSVIPNFHATGNNPVRDDRIGMSTRVDRIETTSQHFV